MKVIKPLAFRWRAWREVRRTEREIQAEDRTERKARRRTERKTRGVARQEAGPVPGSLRVPRAVALIAIAAVIAAASLTSFAESYRGLFDWAREHGLSGLWAAAWPLQLDTFIAVGELALFVALVDGWRTRSRGGAWAVTLLGLAASVAGNIGHVTSHHLSDRATAAVPPLAAAAALAVGLGVLKRVVEAHTESAPGPAPAPGEGSGSAPAPAPVAPALNGQARPSRTPGAPVRTRARSRQRTPGAPVTETDAALHYASELAEGSIPSQRQIRKDLHVGQDRARDIRAHLEECTRT